MSVSVSMPQLGESVTEGTVTRWLKKEGERVEVDEPLLEVSTDKVDTEIPSPASGILRGISVDEDETVAVGAQLATIDDGASGDAAPAADDSASAEPAEAESAQAPPPSEAGFPVTRSQPSAVREPERELSAPAPSPPDLVLNAISERDGHAVALINDRLVREGDEFDGVKILRIGEAEVEVERAGRRSVIRF